jgi:membrane protein
VWWRRSHRFFTDEIWEKRLDELPPWQALRYRSARTLYCVVRGLVFEETLHLRAAALTYFTVLSLVPLLAFGFALLKGFGAYDAMTH